MKKIIKSIFAMVICLSVVLTAFSMTAFAATDATTSAPAYTIEDETVTASADIDNSNGSATANVMLVLAQFDGTILKSAVIGETSVAAGGTGTVVAEADEVSGATVKCFVWEKSTLAPLPVVEAEKPAHAVTGALEDSDFSSIKTYFYSTDGTTQTLTRSTSVVATTAVGGDGYLYTNLHAGNTPTNTGNAGSPPVTDWVESNSGTYRYISVINDTDAIGADFFIFKGGNANNKAWNVANTAMAALNTGDTWVSFNLTHPARVTIYAPGKVSESSYVTEGGWTNVTVGSEEGPHIYTMRKTDLHPQNYFHKIYKDFPAGQVVIPYDTTLGSLMQAPIITVVPR